MHTPINTPLFDDLPTLQTALARVPELADATVVIGFDRTNADQRSIEVLRPDGTCDLFAAGYARAAFHDWRAALRGAGVLTLRIETRIQIPEAAAESEAPRLSTDSIATLKRDLQTQTAPADLDALDVLLTAQRNGYGASIETQPLLREAQQQALYKMTLRWAQHHRDWLGQLDRGVFLLLP